MTSKHQQTYKKPAEGEKIERKKNTRTRGKRKDGKKERRNEGNEEED